MSSFDDKVDVLGVVEDHAKAVFELEDEQAQKLLAVYGKAAAQMRRRLANLPRDSFSAQQVRVTLAQVQAALSVLRKDLSDQMDIGAQLMAEKGVGNLVTEIETFNDDFDGAVQLVNMDVIKTALNTKARLINNYQSSLDAYDASLRARISDGLTNLVAQHLGPEAIYTKLIDDDAIGRFFDGEAWKLRRIVRTELHGMYGTAKLDALTRVGADNPTLRKTLYHPMDSRTAEDSVYLRSLQLRPKLQDPFVYSWKGHRRIFLAPPDRPNDRAILIPYDRSWN